MFWLLGVLLLLLPLAEFWLLMELRISLWAEGILALATAIPGWWMARREGLSLWAELESDILNARLPTPEGLEAMLIVLGGWMLIVPGLLTDFVGLLLVIPQPRKLLVEPLRGLIRRVFL